MRGFSKQLIRPASGYSKPIYNVLNAALPILVLLLVRLDFETIAFLLVLLAKWRIFAMRPRYWIPNIRANAVDIFVGLSMVVFMAGTDTWGVQVFWTVFYLAWILWLKPRSDQLSVMAQALIAQAVALVSFYQAYPNHTIVVGVVALWVVCYVSARHFLGAFDETYTRQISVLWAWFGASIAWVLEHWVITYLALPQVAMVVTLTGYGLALLYYLHSNQNLKVSVKRQLIALIAVLLLIIIVFSDWQDKTVG